MTDDDQGISRRNVLRNTVGTVGALAVGGAAASASAAGIPTTTDRGGSSGPAIDSLQATSGKRGGHAQFDGTVRRYTPFTLVVEGTEMRPASCMSEQSSLQTYVTYSIQYCDSEDDEADGTLYMLPDEAALVPDEVYEIRAVQPCRASDLQMVAMGPSNQACADA